MTGGADSCRIDAWLCRARFSETLSLATRSVVVGGMRLTRGAALNKPGKPVKVGDVLAFQQDGRWLTLRGRVPTGGVTRREQAARDARF